MRVDLNIPIMNMTLNDLDIACFIRKNDLFHLTSFKDNRPTKKNLYLFSDILKEV